MANEVYVTAEGLDELKQKYDYLVNVKRAECAEQIKIARGFGDLSENAEYDAAKEAQGRVEQEIKELDEKIQHAVVIEQDSKSKKISLGDKVKVFDPLAEGTADDPHEIEYTIVGTIEADINENRISNESPLGAALLGRKVGEKVSVQTPGGKVTYEILSKSK